MVRHEAAVVVYLREFYEPLALALTPDRKPGFLIPLPWVGPVLAPVLVAISMVISGTHLIWREWAAEPIRISWQHWTAIVLGGLIIIVAFCWDYRNVVAGGMPTTFPWSIFLVGEAISLGGYALVFASRDHTK